MNSMAMINLRNCLMMAILTAAIAAPPKDKPRDISAALTSIEDRIQALERVWNRIDHRLQQDADKIDTLHVKLDRLEKLLSGKVHQVQSAVDRTTATCQSLQYKINFQTSEPVRRANAREAQSGDTFQKPNKKDVDLQFENKRPNVMQQDSSWVNRDTQIAKDLWRRSFILEGMIKNSMALTNATRKESNDGLRSLSFQIRRSCPSYQYHFNQTRDHVTNIIQKRLAETNNKMDARFKEILLEQNRFLESCHRIQIQEKHLESEITKVLEKMFDFFKNKTMAMNKEFRSTKDLINSHYKNISDSVKRIRDETEVNSNKYETSIQAIYEKLFIFYKELQEEVLYNDKRVESTNLKLLKESLNDINNVVNDAVKSATEKMVCNVRFKDSERDDLVKKLTASVQSLQELLVQREDDMSMDSNEDDLNDSISEELDAGSLKNIKTAEGLIWKLENIKYERISTDKSTEHDENGFKSKKCKANNVCDVHKTELTKSHSTEVDLIKKPDKINDNADAENDELDELGWYDEEDFEREQD